MSARVKPARRPSRLAPAVLGLLIAVVGFATLMIRLDVTREGYRLPALHDEIARLQDENRALRLTAAQLTRTIGCARSRRNIILRRPHAGRW